MRRKTLFLFVSGMIGLAVSGCLQTAKINIIDYQQPVLMNDAVLTVAGDTVQAKPSAQKLKAKNYFYYFRIKYGKQGDTHTIGWNATGDTIRDNTLSTLAAGPRYYVSNVDVKSLGYFYYIGFELFKGGLYMDGQVKKFDRPKADANWDK